MHDEATGAGDDAGTLAAAAQPVVSVVSGNPDAVELAALVAVLSGLSGGAGDEPAGTRSAWSDPAFRLCGPQPRGGGWRSSALPR